MAAARKRGNWSTQELERLKVLFPRAREADVARMLRRSVDSVRRKAKDLFRRPGRRGTWSADDDLQLRMAYGALDLRALALVLARSERDVAARIEHLRKIRRRGAWSPDEERLLKKLYATRDDADLEVCLSRSRTQIQKTAARLCLSKDKRNPARSPERRGTMPRWTEADVALLRELYPHHDNLEIARRLGRSVTGVANKASVLGLKKSPATLARMGRRNVGARYGRAGSERS